MAPLDLNDYPQQSEYKAPPARAAVSTADALSAFRQAAAARGVSLPPDIITDGEIHRCDTTGKNGDGDAAYLLHLDGGLPAGGFQNWQDGVRWQDWHADPGRPLTPAESDELRRRVEADRIKRVAAKEAKRADTAARARDIWDKATKDPDHPYLARKGIAAHGVRQEDRTNYLVVPIKDASGALINLQRIDAEGIKRFLPGGRTAGCFFAIGDLECASSIFIGEGFATVATAIEAIGLELAGVVAFSAESLLAVAKMLREKYPKKHFMLLADDDWHTEGNPGVTKATETAQAIGAYLAVPEFPESRREGDTDFNDLAALAGLDEVRRQLHGAQPPAAQDMEIVPPAKSIADVDAMVQTLNRSDMGSEPQRQTMTMALKGLASLNLGVVSEESVLKQIVARTGATLATLKKGLSQLKREMGIKITVTPEANVICRQYVFVKTINAFWDRKSNTVCELFGVRNMHQADMPVDDETGKPMDPLDIMLKGTLGGMTCQRVDKISFLPGENEIFQDEESSALNMWTKPEIIPIEGDVSIFVEHVEYILGGDAFIRDHLLDFLAHLVQKPADKIKHTILIIGPPGIGKSAIAEMMIRLLGEKNVTAIESSDLSSSFNEWMDGVQLVIINEMQSINTRETKNRLKQYITDPWIRINRKKVSTYSYRNRVNFLMFSNHEDATSLEPGDRRYLVWKSKAVAKDEKYYKDLWYWFEHGGAENLLDYLQKRDISGFKPNAPPPVTEGKEEAIADSRTTIEAYLQDLFDAGANPFRHDLVVVTDLMEYLANRKSNKVVTHKQIISFLRKVGGVSLGQQWLRDNTRPSVWAIRNCAEWELVTAADFKEAWRDIDEAPLAVERRNEYFGRT